MAQNTPAEDGFIRRGCRRGSSAWASRRRGACCFPLQAPPPQGPLLAMTSGDADDPGPDPESAQKRAAKSHPPDPETAPLPGLAAPSSPSSVPPRRGAKDPLGAAPARRLPSWSGGPAPRAAGPSGRPRLPAGTVAKDIIGMVEDRPQTRIHLRRY